MNENGKRKLNRVNGIFTRNSLSGKKKRKKLIKDVVSSALRFMF